METVAALRAAFELAPFTEDGWNLALRALAQATGSSRAQLIAIGQEHIRFNWVSDMPAGFQNDALNVDIYNPAINYRVATIAPAMQVTWEHHYDQARAIHTDEGYLELSRKYDFEHGAQVVLAHQANTLFGLALLRGKSEGRTCEAERAILAQVAPCVLSAIRTQESIEHAGTRMLQSSLEALQTAAILLDAKGSACFVSSAACRLLGPETLQVRGNTIRALNPETDRALGKRIGAVLAGVDPGPADLWMRNAGGLILVDVRPLPAPAWHLGSGARAILTLRPLLKASGALSSPHEPGALKRQAAQLATALDLTRSEAEVTGLLSHGLSRKDIAVLRNVSPQTVNSQLRTIFQKCAVNRESELAALARSILEILRP